jgi:hypothetical protein
VWVDLARETPNFDYKSVPTEKKVFRGYLKKHIFDRSWPHMVVMQHNQSFCVVIQASRGKPLFVDALEVNRQHTRIQKLTIGRKFNIVVLFDKGWVISNLLVATSTTYHNKNLTNR